MSSINGQQTLKDTYALIAELWCSPPETDTEREEIKHDAENVLGYNLMTKIISVGCKAAIAISKKI